MRSKAIAIILVPMILGMVPPAQASHENEREVKVENISVEKKADVDTRRSAVADFVKNLLDVADRNVGGIGAEVREVAQEQNDSEEKVTEAIKKVENRNKWKNFFLGTDYKNVGALRSEIAKTENRLAKLNKTLEKMASSTDAVKINEQIQSLKQLQDKLNAFLKQNESKFSLFGWFVKLLNK